MIDFNLGEFIDALSYLHIAQTRARHTDPERVVDDGAKAIITDNLSKIERHCVRLGMPQAITRISRLQVIGMAPYTYGQIKNEIDELYLAVEHDAASDFFCHYNRDRLEYVTRMPVDWAATFKSFASAKPEIERGIDCYAIGHNTACVFHMCRAGEIGLRAIGRERGVRRLRRNVPIEWGTWGQVFQAIGPTIEDIRKKPNGPNKTNALAFYDCVLSDLRAIQSLYRDQTMHLRDNYDLGETQSAIFRVRELMNTLADKLDENSTRAIPWSAWR
jgi:hypothetical protein